MNTTTDENVNSSSTDEKEPQKIEPEKGKETTNEKIEKESERVANFFVFDDFTDEATPAVKISDVDEIYKKKGFYYAITHGKSVAVSGGNENPGKLTSELLPEVLLKEHELEINERLNSVSARVQLHHSNIKEQITLNNKKLADLEIQINQYLAEVTIEKTGSQQLNDNIKQCMEELRILTEKIGSSKETLISDRIEEVKKQLEELQKVYAGLEKEQNDKAFEDFNKNEEYFKGQEILYGTLKRNCEVAFESVQEKLSWMMQSGFSIMIARILITIGIMSAFAAGSFYAIWATPKGDAIPGTLGNESNIQSILINTIGNIRQHYSFQQLLLGLTTYIVIIAGVSFLSYYLVNREKRSFNGQDKKEEDENAVQVEVNYNSEEEENMLKVRYKANSLYLFWIRMMPWIVFFITTIVLLSYDKSKEGFIAQFNKQLTAASNQALGTLIAFIFTGLIVLYIAKIAEPRNIKALKDLSAPPSPKHFLQSWEITMSLVFFVIMILSMIIYKINNTFSHYSGIIGLSGFLLSCTATGLTLGYGYRYVSLIDLSENLEYAFAFYNHRLSLARTPIRVNYMRFRQFRESLKGILLSLQNLIHNKTDTAHELTGETSEQKIKRFFQRFRIPIVFRSYRKKRKKEEKEKESTHNRTDNFIYLEGAEAQYFPLYSKQMKLIQERMRIIKKELEKIEELDSSIYKKSGVFGELTKQKKNLEETLENLNKGIIKINKKHEEENNRIKVSGHKERNLLQEGFLIGLYYRNNFNNLH
jgi:phosphatidylglycerophosphatase A